MKFSTLLSRNLKASLHAAICRPQQIGERIGAYEWRSDVCVTPIATKQIISAVNKLTSYHLPFCFQNVI